MSKFAQRSSELELMDELNSGGEEIKQTLKELKTINRFLGGNHVTTNGLQKLAANSVEQIRIADIGCGGGDILLIISDWCRRHKINSQLIGVDANPNIIEYAKVNTSGRSEINFLCQDVFDPTFAKEKFDIITATLFCHHFKDEDLIALIKSWTRQSTRGVVINDLHRHWFAYYAIQTLTRTFSKSEMVINDAPLSVLRSFSKNDWKKILDMAGISHYTISWKWAFRWQIIIYSGLA
jgi:2-polyprenyl-3-methyl-5-hydroxy-6-metoxy-1,4-benzoquinol methylase